MNHLTPVDEINDEARFINVKFEKTGNMMAMIIMLDYQIVLNLNVDNDDYYLDIVKKKKR
jgi:hypothetical protein